MTLMVSCINEMVNAVLTRRGSGQTPTGAPSCSGSNGGIGAAGRKRRSGSGANSRYAARSPIAPSRRKRTRLKASAGISAPARVSRRACARPNFSTPPIASSVRAGYAIGLGTDCASLWRETSGFRPVCRCISTRPAKCAMRESSGGAERRSGSDCTRPRRRTRSRPATGTR
jgi:hypothetical protein